MHSFTLPMSHLEIEYLNYLPQQAFERIEEVAFGNAKIDLGRVARVSIEEIADKLGADRAQKIQDQEGQAQYSQLLDEAKKEVVAMEASIIVTTVDGHKASHIKMHGMIINVKKGDKQMYDCYKDEESDLEKILGKLPTNDYSALEAKLDVHVKEQQDERVKLLGQSKDSSQASQSPVPEAKGSPETTSDSTTS